MSILKEVDNAYSLRKEKNGGILFKPYRFPIEVNMQGYKIVKLLKEGKDYDYIKKALKEKYKIKENLIEKDLLNFLLNLEEHGFLKLNIKKNKKIKNTKKYPLIKANELSAPFYISWDCTQKCNLKCLHCYSSSGSTLKNELTTYEAKKLIDQMSKEGIFFLHFLGGEPLLREDLFELDEYANKSGVKTAFNTNGTFISDKIDKILKSKFSYIVISIQGINSNQHDNFVCKKGAFDKALNGIEILVKNGIEVYTVTSINKDNYVQLPKFIELFDKLGVKVCRFQGLMPSGRGENLFKEEGGEWLSKKEFDWCVKTLKKEKKRRKVYIDGFEGFLPHENWNLIKKETIIPNIIGCSGGISFCHISAEGKVYPCPGLMKKEFELGDTRKESIKEIWDKNLLRIISSSKCKMCNTICTGECKQHIYYKNSKHGIYGTL